MLSSISELGSYKDVYAASINNVPCVTR